MTWRERGTAAIEAARKVFDLEWVFDCRDWLFIIGGIVVVRGVWMFSHGIAWIIGGLMVMGAAYFMSIGGTR